MSPFAVLIHGVKCVSIPDSDEVSLSIVVIIANDFNQLTKFVLKLPGDLGSSEYFLEGIFALHTNVFI